MEITYPIPAQCVATYVQRIMVIEHNSVTVPFTLPLFANGAPTILFQTAEGKIGDHHSHLTLFGQTILPNTLTIHNNFVLVAYFLKPCVLPSLFGIAANELTDAPLDLDLHSARSRLQEKLLHAASVPQMLGLIDNYILAESTKYSAAPSAIKYAAEKIAISPSEDILIKLRNELHITERSFQRLFAKNIGVSPGQFRRISQFNTAFQQLNMRKHKNLSDIAYHNGFADQSHYIRSFREFTNVTPREYLDLSKL
jgi:AraC-like DNA-binding protein